MFEVVMLGMDSYKKLTNNYTHQISVCLSFILLLFNIMQYTPPCISAFYQITIDPYSCLKFLIFLYTHNTNI